MLKTTLALIATLAACSKNDKDKPADGDGKDTPAAKATSSASKGEPASAVDPAVIAAAKKVAADCKWNDKGYFDSCDARKAFELMKLEKRHAASLVVILEEKTPQMMWLAASAMYKEDWFKDDKALQERILAVAESLPSDLKGGTANMLGRTIGFFKLAKTGLVERAKALALKDDVHPALRVGLANWLLAGNQDSVPIYELTRDLAAKGPTPGLQVAALVALSAGYNHHATEEMCKLWLDALPKVDERPAAMIAAHITKGDLQVNNQNEAFPFNWAMISSDTNKCPPAIVDAALDLIEKRVDEGTAKDNGWTWTLKGPHKSKNATPEQKKKAIEIAKKYADNTAYGGYQRGSAIDLLVELDPASAKALAETYKDDKDTSLRSAVERVQKKLASK